MLILLFLSLYSTAAEGLIADDQSDGFLITRAVLITMSVAFAYIVFVIVLMVWCRYKRQARKARLNLLSKENGDTVGFGGGVGGECTGDGGEKDDEIEPCLPEKSTQHKSDDTSGSVVSKNSKKSSAQHLDDELVLRKSLSQVCQLGKGDFGEILIMKMKIPKKIVENGVAPENNDVNGKTVVENEKSINEITSVDTTTAPIKDDDVEQVLVLVKVMKKIKDDFYCAEFRRQLDLFKMVSHKNVSKLYGLCKDNGPHAMILEWTDWVSFIQFFINIFFKHFNYCPIPFHRVI